MAPFRHKTELKKTLIVAVFVGIVWYFLFSKRSVKRSDESWESMASVILNSRRGEISQKAPSTNGVPRIIHQTWKSTDVPVLYRKWMRSWLTVNPDWEYWMWTDDDMWNFIERKYPDYLDLYDNYPANGYRVDAFRYFILYEYGGVYVDLDMEAIRPLSEYVSDHHCFLSQEPLAHAHFLSPMGIPLVSNALMGCFPEHPFFADVIRYLPDRAGIYGWADILSATGPYMLTSTYKQYKNTLFYPLDAHSDIHLANPDDFHPSLDSSMVDSMREMCVHSQGHAFLSDKYTDAQQEICAKVIGYDFMANPAPNSYTNHHWTHSWAGPRNDPWGVHNRQETFDVRDLHLAYNPNGS